MNANSRLAYNNILKSGRMRKAQLAIVGALRTLGKPSTIYDVAEYMKVYPNTISGRFSELKEAGVIEQVGTKRKKINGRTYCYTQYLLTKQEIEQHCKEGK